MNTHSVDLSMDLATLATLNTNNDQAINAIVWDAGKNNSPAPLALQEYMERGFAREEVYSKEFEKHGMERLYIKKSVRQPRQPSGKNRLH